MIVAPVWPSRSPRSARRPRRSPPRASSGPARCSSPRPATTAPTGARFGTVASPAASPGWLAVGATDGRSDAARRVDVALGTDGVADGRRRRAARGRAVARSSDTPRCRSCSRPARRSPTARARRPTSSPAPTRATSARPTATSLVSGKAVLLPRDGAPIAQRAAAAGAAGAKALVLYGDGGAPARRARARRSRDAADRRAPGRSGRGGRGARCSRAARVTITFGDRRSTDDNPASGSVARVLVDRPGVRRLGQARPRRAGRRGHDLARRAAATLRRERHVRRGRAGRGRRGARAARRIPTWTPRIVRGALVGTAAGRRRRGRRRRAARRGAGRRRGRPGGRRGGHGRRRARVAQLRPRARRERSRSRACSRSPTRAARPCTSRIALVRDGVGDGGITVDAHRRAARARDRARRARCRCTLTLTRTGLPDQTRRDRRLGARRDRRRRHDMRVPWALVAQRRPRRRPDRRAPRSRRRSCSRRPTATPRRRLALVLGAAQAPTATARLEIAPVQRLSVDLYRESQLLGRLLERHELLPGSYRYGITGIDPSTGKALDAGHLPARGRRRLERRGDE